MEPGNELVEGHFGKSRGHLANPWLYGVREVSETPSAPRLALSTWEALKPLGRAVWVVGAAGA